jgi:hypothetical protein
MIPNHTNRNVQTSGVTATGEFQISLAHSAHIMRILRSQLYSDKVLAVLREYSANAWDANREAGRGDVPIKVTLPTVMDPTLYIRDFGPGISHENMFAIYAQYGVSTKRGDDGQVGMLGIGSKSGFAYTDSFTITTWQNGVQRIYTALLDNGEKGTLNLLDESESDEPTGTMIQIPVRPTDIPDFVTKSLNLFYHFKPRPDINITLPPELVPEVIMKHGDIQRGCGVWKAVMGCIAYRIDLKQLRGLNAHRGGAGLFLDNLDGNLYFDIGEIEIAASRESLEYSDKTKQVLIDKFIDLVDEFVKHTLDNIEAGDFSFWEKRCRAQVINDLGLPVPPILKILTDETVDIGSAKSFIVTYGPKQTTIRRINVSSQTRLIIRDETRKVDGYGLTGLDYVIRLNDDVTPKPTLDDVKVELAEIIDTTKMTGVQVVLISSIPWHAKAKFTHLTKHANKKHQVKTFVLKQGKVRYADPWSNCWEIEERVPTPEDVFVLLRGFKVLDDPTDTETSTTFYSQYVSDKEILEQLKIPVPRIYGYKSTPKDPADLSKIPGTSYKEWRLSYLKEVLNNQGVKDTLTAITWTNLINRDSKRYGCKDTSISPKILAKLFSRLRREHQICKLLSKILVARRELKRTNKKKVEALNKLLRVLKDENVINKTEQQSAKENIEKEYPMFELFVDGFNSLIIEEEHIDRWIEYIQLVDKVRKGPDNEDAISHRDRRSDHGGMEGEGPRSEERGPELQQSEESSSDSIGDGGMGEDRGSSDGLRDSERVVQRPIHPFRRVSDILRAGCP